MQANYRLKTGSKVPLLRPRQMDEAGSLAEYERLKTLATDKFKEKKYAEAIKYYEKACEAICSYTGSSKDQA